MVAALQLLGFCAGIVHVSFLLGQHYFPVGTSVLLYLSLPPNFALNLISWLSWLVDCMVQHSLPVGAHGRCLVVRYCEYCVDRGSKNNRWVETTGSTGESSVVYQEILGGVYGI
ncbi:unnamed protein product [Ectocarpus sp. 8 AP-2014]